MGRNKKKSNDKKRNLQECLHSETLKSNTQDNSDSEDTINKVVEQSTEFSDKKIMKRPLANDDSDTSDKEKSRKPKKRKKPLGTEETTGKKNKKSLRQIKREKYAERIALEQALAKDQTKSQCLSYLSQWKHDRSNWKFMKAKQVWLYKNKFSTNLVPNASWPLLLEYFESAKGNIKNMLLTDANTIIKQMDEWTESQTNKDSECDKDQPESTEIVKPDETIYNRARSLIQCLQE